MCEQFSLGELENNFLCFMWNTVPCALVMSEYSVRYFDLVYSSRGRAILIIRDYMNGCTIGWYSLLLMVVQISIILFI